MHELKRILVGGLILLATVLEPAIGATPYESIVKGPDFRASLSLSAGAGFVELDYGHTYYKAANLENCAVADVLVHGFSVPSYIWDPTFEFLRAHRRCVITLDLYGRGYSDNPDVPYADSLFANQVLALLDHLGVGEANFFGLSNGGRVVSQIAGVAPERVRQLIYVASSGFKAVSAAANTGVTESEVAALIAQYPTLPAAQLADFKNPSKFPDWPDRYAELLRYKGFARALISTRKHHDSTGLDRIHAALQETDIPIATIWGDSDTVVVYDTFAERLDAMLPRRREYVVPDSGHLPHLENRRYFEAILRELLEL